MAAVARSGVFWKTLHTGIGLAMVFVTAPARPETDPPLNQAPYGAWTSPLSAAAVAGARVAFHDLSSTGGRLYWTENLPDEGGVTAVFGMTDGVVASKLTATGTNVRTRVHEYGGAPYVVVDDTLFFSQFSDQRLYAMKPGGTAVAVTPAGYRYADCTPWPPSGKSAEALICVREDHTDPAHVRNALVRLALTGEGAGEVLYADSDFVAFPRLSHDGKRIAFVTWNFPNMPWDGTQLRVAAVSEQGLHALTTVAGGATESVLEPRWEDDGTLYFISDRSGFWNLYALDTTGVRAVSPRAAEFASPLWSLGQANYALMGDRKAVVRFAERGIDHLAVLDLNQGTLRVLDLPYVEYEQVIRIDGRHVGVLANSATTAPVILKIDVGSGSAQTLRSAGSSILPTAAISVATQIDFPSAHGRIAHAFFYPPTNPGFQAPAGRLPPLLTLVHGGPTGQASPAYSSALQFWTSRGFAVVDVNYGGSSGFGRAYRQELNGNWGVVDVEDVIAAVRFLISTGRVDPAKIAIRGGSAGGYTVLLALSTSDVFRAGADYYGVSDMTALARDTHKFESRYLDSMIGPLPQAQSVYDSRSPLNHLDGFKAPLIVFQGADDPIVPPNQSARIVEALRARHAPVAYVLYPGEGHGFRKPENMISSLQAELSFYGQVFGFTPSDKLPALTIENHPPLR